MSDPPGCLNLSCVQRCSLLLVFSLLCVPILLTILLWCFGEIAYAETRTVLSQGAYRMGARDTKEDAMRLATEAAKRNALEQVATYLESITVVEGVDITRDEITTYTAGLVVVHDQQTNLSLDGDTVIITVDLTSQIDTEEVAQAILALRENEDARHQLAALKRDIDDLHQELEVATQSLAVALSAEQAQQASVQRQELLDRMQSHAMVSQAWTDWVMIGPVTYPSQWVGITPSHTLLTKAWELYPGSPHVPSAQRVMVASTPATATQTIVPITHVIPVQPGARTTPLPLNEISHRTPTMPVQLGNQPGGITQMPTRVGTRTFTDMRQLAPLSSPPSGNTPAGGQPRPPALPSVQSLQQFLQAPTAIAPSRGSRDVRQGSRSIQSLRQFLQPPATVPPTGQPPVTRAVPTSPHHIQSPLLVPHLPHYGVPRVSEGPGRYGRGGHGGNGFGPAGGGRAGGKGR
ncbi:MAG: uncharacterized protein K0S94_988 [Nitrospira sp.]|nr:uncharacterized protein [Nitrospira sp.]